MIKNDLLDMCIIATSPLTTYEPLAGIITLPYVFKSLDDIGSTMSGELGKVLEEKLEEKGFTVLAWWVGTGFRSVNNSVRPIYKPEDMKGMKIRVMEDPVSVDTFKAFGAIPVPIAWGELHAALQTKTVDAHENNPQVIDKYGFIEMAKYYSLTEHTNYGIPVVISTKKLNSLGEEAKNILFEAAKMAGSAVRECADVTIGEAYEGIKAQGGEVNQVDKDAFIDAAKPVIEKYKKQFGEEGVRLIDLIMKK
jgi:tripartite ATP-independent transporter DctP family solute receptor